MVVKSDIADRLWAERNKCYRIAFSYLKNEQDALDVVSESYLKALKNLDKIQDYQFSTTWLVRIVINTAIDHLRKSKKFISTEIAEDYSNEEIYSREEIFELSQALEHLPTELKTVILLRFFEDLKIAEIAEVLEIPLSTVKHRLYSALEKLNVSLALANEED